MTAPGAPGTVSGDHLSAQSAGSPPPGTPRRLYFLDWLRIIALALLVLYHVGMYYVTWDFHVKSPFAGPALEPWMKLSEPWRMGLLFFVSGAASAHLFGGGPRVALVRRRSRQLLWPLLCGVVLLVPPQSYAEVVQKFGYADGFADFLGLYFSGHHGFCRDGQCLILPTWNHLWFLPYLWVYTMLLCALLAWRPQALRSAARRVHQASGAAALLVVPMLFLLAARLLLAARYPVTHALWGDWFTHAVSLAMFAAGAVVAAQPALWDRVASVRWIALPMAAAAWAALVFLGPTPPVVHAVLAAFAWAAVLAAVGFAVRHLDVDVPVRPWLVEAVFPVYVLHQTILIVGSQWLLPQRWPPAMEGPVLVLITLLLSVAGVELIGRVGPLRPWFGLRPRQRPAGAVPAAGP